MNEFSLSDIAAATSGGWNNNWGGGLGGSLIAGGLGGLVANSFFGGGWGGNRGNCVTEADLCTSQNFNNLQNSVGRISDNQAAIARQTDNAICQIGYQNLQNTNTLASQIAACCCETQRGVDSVKFDMANYASAIQVNDTANTQKVLDKLCQMELANKDAVIAQQGQRIAALEADARMCGVLRWPTSVTYATNCNPFFGGCGCGCNGNV